MRILHDAPGRHRWITVGEDNGIRYLLLNGCEEGAMGVQVDEPVFQYLWFHKCSCLGDRPPRRVLVLGAGAFSAPRFLARDHSEADIDVVDLEPELGPVAMRYFRLGRREYSRIRFHGMPAEQFLAEERDSYDFIFDDLFDGFQHVPEAQRSIDHLRGLRALLTSEGVCIKNLIWDPRAAVTRAACTEAMTAWQAVFPQHTALALSDPDRGHNLIFIGRPVAQAFDWVEARKKLRCAGLPEPILDGCRPSPLL
jgi:spermidine synthase